MKFRQIYCSVFIVMMLCSCNAPIYNTTTLQAPLLNSKGDAEIEGSWAVLQGPCFAGAYAITDDLAVKGYALFSNYGGNDSNSSIHQQAFELGIGTYGFAFRKIPWEAYLMFMNATSNYNGPQTTQAGANFDITRIHSDFWRIALQADFMTNEVWVKDRKIFQGVYLDHAIGARISFVNFFHYHEVFHNDPYNVDVTDDKAPRLLCFEISSITKYGSYPFFLQSEIGLSFPFVLNKEPYSLFGYSNPFVFSIGASLCFY
ncbi:MAG: hypothetical protein ACHQM6_10550 [Candidatus Kapaibacterium sp.]